MHQDIPTLSISELIIQQCRRFGLLYNERTTILSHSDEIQLIQYCLACYKQKKNEDFEASPSETLDVAEKIQTIECNLIEKHLQDYKIISEPEVQKTDSGADSVEDPEINTKPDKADTIEMRNDFEENESLINDVLSLFVSHKETNNQVAILDCYMRFFKEVANNQSDLHNNIKSSNDLEISSNESDPLLTLQIKILNCLRGINPKVTLNTSCDMDHLENIPTVLTHSQLVGTPEPMKTPSRARSSHNCNSPLCSPKQFSTPKTPAHKRLLQKAFVHDLFRCYIHLLVNSRSQLALARIFNIPDRGLDHNVFTNLRHEAMSAGLSMYQYLASFIMRIRLGGKGYAPSSSTPLMSHIKGLGCLLDFTQKLQTVMEEVTDIRSACRRIVNIVKNNLIQCKSGKFTRRLVEPCASEIHATLSALIDAQASAASSPPKAAGTGGTVIGRHCLQVLQCFLDQAALCTSPETDDKMLQDLSFSSNTPTQIPCLLSQFRSPCMLETVEEEIFETKSKQLSKAGKRNSNFVSSALYLEEEDQPILTQRTLSTIDVLPCKTLVDAKESDSPRRKKRVADIVLHARTANPKVPITTNNKDNPPQAKKTKKRKAVTAGQEKSQGNVLLTNPSGSDLNKNPLEDMETTDGDRTLTKSSETVGDQCNVKSKKVGKSCRKRLLPQVKGQSKITGFFKL